MPSLKKINTAGYEIMFERKEIVMCVYMWIYACMCVCTNACAHISLHVYVFVPPNISTLIDNTVNLGQ
jgi:hypothetical protein